MEFWQTMVATAAGGLITLIGISIAAVTQHRSQRADRVATRQHSRDDAQRAWIIELQDALLVEITEAIEHDQERRVREEYVGDAYDHDLIEEEVIRRRGRWSGTLTLASRVRDSDLRNLAYDTVSYVEKFYRAAWTSDEWDDLLKAVSMQEAFNKRSGEVLDLL